MSTMSTASPSGDMSCRLVIKHTFLDIEGINCCDNDDGPLEEWPSTGRRNRAATDSALYDVTLESYDAPLDSADKMSEHSGMSNIDTTEASADSLATPRTRTSSTLTNGSADLFRFEDGSYLSKECEGSVLENPISNGCLPSGQPPNKRFNQVAALEDTDRLNSLLSENRRLMMMLQESYMRFGGVPTNFEEQPLPRNAPGDESGPGQLNRAWAWLPETHAVPKSPSGASAMSTGSSAPVKRRRPKTRRKRVSNANASSQDGNKVNTREVVADAEDEQTSTGTASCTPPPSGATVKLRGIPRGYTRAMVMRMLDDEGFAGKYDFLYLPIDFSTHVCLGYAFVNFTCESCIGDFRQVFDGYSGWSLPGGKAGKVCLQVLHQGFEAHIERYRNSPVMHATVPDDFKPVLFCDGVRIAFAPPTKALKAPRIRKENELEPILIA